MTRSGRRLLRLAGALAAALHLSAWAGAALADGDGARKERSAEAFELGMQSVRQKRYEAALRHFRESNTLVPRPQTLWNIIGAEMQLGMNAAAYRDLASYLGLFRQLSPDRLRLAAELRLALEAKLAHVTVVVDPPGASVLVDGAKSERAAWVDPGDRVIRAEAPGMEPEQKQISLEAGERRTVRFTLAPPRPPEPVPDPSAPQRRAGLTFVGLGAAGLAAGAVLGALALERKIRMNQTCGGNSCDTGTLRGEYRELQSEASDFASGATLAFVVGAAVSGVGAYIALEPSVRRDRGSLVISPAVSLVPIRGGAVGFLGGDW